MSSEQNLPSAYAEHAFNPAGDNDSWSNLFAYIGQGARVLDVGCSTGTFGEALERLKGCSVVGIDLDEADVAIAAGRITQALVFDVTSNVPLDPLGTFDVIVFADVLEHLSDPRATLRRLGGLLNPGGFVVFSIPNMTHASVRIDLLGGTFGYTQVGILDRTHVHFYDRVEVEAIFSDAQYTISEQNPVVFGYPDAIIDDRLLSLGLQTKPGSAEFREVLSRTDGNVLQFVGKAVLAPEEGPQAPLREREFPPDEINREFAAVHQWAQGEHERAEAERAAAAAAREAAEAARAELARLQNRISELRAHPVRFALQRVRRSR